MKWGILIKACRRNAKKSIAGILAISQFLSSSVVMANAVADPLAGANRPIIVDRLGTDIVEIASPNRAGISHNKYWNFDVGSRGLILNNSAGIVDTNLAGAIFGNARLRNSGSAQVIFNEVNGLLPSNLRGAIEVAGQRADVIIANPRGIVGNGAGFINANRVTLTTGTPVWNGNGGLDSFHVTKGDIKVTGNGINASTTSELDLLGKRVQIDAGINADELNVIAGENDVNYGTLHANPIGGNTDQFAIDMSEYGGMYANKIYLISTNDGVGVNTDGAIYSSENLQIRSNGKIIHGGTIYSNGSINIESIDRFENNNKIFAKDNINILTDSELMNNLGDIKSEKNINLFGKNIILDGIVYAGLDSSGIMGDMGNLTLKSQENIIMAGQVSAAGNITINTKNEINNNSYIYSGADTSIQADGKVNNAENGIITAQKNTEIIADSIQSDGIIMSGLNYDWTLGMRGDTTLRSEQDIVLNGGITAAEDVDIESKANVINHGAIYAQGNNKVVAWHDVINTTPEGNTEEYPALISAGRSTTIQADNIISDGLIAAGKNRDGTESGNTTFENDVAISARQVTQLHGNIGTEYGSIKISADEVDLSNGKIVSKNDVDIKANGDINNENGTIVANNGTTSGIRLMSETGNISNVNGTLVNQNNTSNVFLYAKNGDIDNTNGNIASDGKILLNGKNFFNIDGTIIAKDQTTLFFKESLENTGYVGSKTAIMLYGPGTIDNSGKFVASDWVTINGNPYLHNDGVIAAGNQILIYAPNVNDTKGMGAPQIYINGVDLMDPYHWVAYVDPMGFVHWTLEKGSYIPGYAGGFATVLDATLYSIEGDTAKAKAKLIELPLSVSGVKVEGKVLGKVAIKSVLLNDSIKDASKLSMELSKMYKEVALCKGNTGRSIPNNLAEQIAMKEVLSNPLDGAMQLSKITMTDSRWLANEGWVKMSKNVNGIEMHFVYNKKTNSFDDFKFKT